MALCSQQALRDAHRTSPLTPALHKRRVLDHERGRHRNWRGVPNKSRCSARYDWRWRDVLVNWCWRHDHDWRWRNVRVCRSWCPELDHWRTCCDRCRSSDASAAVSAGAGVLNTIRDARARGHCTSWRKVFHQRRKCCDHGKGWCDVAAAAMRQELALRSRRAQARYTQPRATLPTRKQSRRPHEYLTPLLTAEAGQQWGRKDGATTTCLELCLDRMCCVLQLHVKTS